MIVSSEKQFVVPPLGGIVWRHGIDLHPKLPPKGGTTNCAFHFSVYHFPAALSADSNGDRKIGAQSTVRPRVAQSSWDEALDLWDETVWRWDYRSAFNLIYSEVCAIARGNCGSKSTALRLA